MTIYEHAADYHALRSLIDEAVVDQEGNPKELDDNTKLLLMEMAEQWKDDFKAKAERVCQFRLEVSSHIEACRQEAKRLSLRAKVFENRLAGLNYLIFTTLERLNLRKLETQSFVLTIAKNPPALVIDDPDKIPDEYFNTVPETKELDSARLKKALADGGKVAGARLIQAESLRVK